MCAIVVLEAGVQGSCEEGGQMSGDTDIDVDDDERDRDVSSAASSMWPPPPPLLYDHYITEPTTRSCPADYSPQKSLNQASISHTGERRFIGASKPHYQWGRVSTDQQHCALCRLRYCKKSLTV